MQNGVTITRTVVIKAQQPWSQKQFAFSECNSIPAAQIQHTLKTETGTLLLRDDAINLLQG